MGSSTANRTVQPPWRKSLATRLIWVSVLMVTLAISAVGGGLIVLAGRAQGESANRLQQQYAAEVSQVISAYMTRAADRLRFFLENEPLASHSPDRQEAVLEELLLSSLPLYSQVSFLDREGQEVSKISRFHTYLPQELESQAESRAFLTASSGKRYMGPVAMFENTGLLSVQVALPVVTKRAEFAGVLSAEVNASHLWRAVAGIRIGQAGYAYLVDTNGRFVAYQMPAEVLQRYGEDMSRVPPVSAFLSGGLAGAGEVHEYKGLFNEEVMGTCAPIMGTDWAVVVEQPTREAYAGVREMKSYLLGLMLAGILLSGALGFLVARRLIGPIRNLTAAAKRLGSGEWKTALVETNRDDEVGVLSQAFNHMQNELKALYSGLRGKVEELESTQKALKESEQNYRILIENQSDLVVKVTSDGRFLFVSPSYCELFGKGEQELLGQTFMPLVHEDDRESTAREMAKLNDPPHKAYVEHRAMTRLGWRWLGWNETAVLDDEGKIDSIIGVGRDITEKSNMERQIQQAQKFEAIGTLAGGIAHDFNNILMGVQGHASLLGMDMAHSPEHMEHIHSIDEYVRSASDLTKQLLGIARGGKYEVKPVDMNDLVSVSASMFGRTKKEIRIHTRSNPSPLVVEADRSQVEQVLLNLYVNAWQAMPEGGELFLETASEDLNEAFCHPHGMEPGAYARISVADTGMGMSESTRKRIFDPFFTTKEKSRGTGLGLASAYGIIKNHGGAITVQSKPGHGATFEIYLPLSGEEIQPESPMEGKLIPGSGTLLLVDDEAMILDVGKMMLERLGYRVLVCGGGEEAIEKVNEMGNRIDLVILDLIMPGMDGGRTFEVIREMQPGLPVMISSGYAVNGQAESVMKRGCEGFIPKPFNLHDLSEKVHRLLVESKRKR